MLKNIQKASRATVISTLEGALIQAAKAPKESHRFANLYHVPLIREYLQSEPMLGLRLWDSCINDENAESVCYLLEYPEMVAHLREGNFWLVRHAFLKSYRLDEPFEESPLRNDALVLISLYFLSIPYISSALETAPELEDLQRMCELTFELHNKIGLNEFQLLGKLVPGIASSSFMKFYQEKIEKPLPNFSPYFFAPLAQKNPYLVSLELQPASLHAPVFNF